MRLARLELLVVLCAAGSSFAAEVANDGNGARLDVSGFYKTLLSGVVLNPDSVSLARTQARLFEEAQALAPPGVELPLIPPLPDAGFLNAHLFRVASKFRFADRFQFDAAWQLQLSVASDPVLAAGSSLSGTVGGTGAGAQRRIVELAGTLGQSGGWRVDHNLDRLAVKVALPFGDLTVGRQVLSWGTGRIWNPTDVLSPFPPTVIDREVRRGFDAVRLAVALGDVTQLDLLYLPQLKAEDQGGVARFQTNTFDWDWSISFGKYVRDLVIGADIVGDIGPISVHAEGAYTVELLGLDTGSVRVGEHFFRGVVGAEARPHEKLLVMLEYSYNGFGTTDPSQYARVLSSARVLRGEIFGAGRHQAAVAANFLATDQLTASLSVLTNLTDPSAMVIPSLEYSMTQTVLVRAGAYLPIGASPDARRFDGLTGRDVLANSEGFQQAVASRGLRSEYGASSFGGFVQVGLYVP